MQRGRVEAGGAEEEEDAPPWGGSQPIGGEKEKAADWGRVVLIPI
jgi:hypothetical protein